MRALRMPEKHLLDRRWSDPPRRHRATLLVTKADTGDYSGAAADYATLGDKNAAFAALEKAFGTRSGLLFIKVDPQFDNLRSDPRFDDLMNRMNFPQ
jgi:hypothetical protein